MSARLLQEPLVLSARRGDDDNRGDAGGGGRGARGTARARPGERRRDSFFEARRVQVPVGHRRLRKVVQVRGDAGDGIGDAPAGDGVRVALLRRARAF